MNAGGEVAFVAPLSGPGVIGNNAIGIWSGTAGNLSLVTRTV